MGVWGLRGGEGGRPLFFITRRSKGATQSRMKPIQEKRQLKYSTLLRFFCKGQGEFDLTDF